jgi:hypothetical protein
MRSKPLNKKQALVMMAAVVVAFVVAWRGGVWGSVLSRLQGSKNSHRAAQNETGRFEQSTANRAQFGSLAQPTLFYALSYKQTAASIRTHFDQYNIQTATLAQKMIMVRGHSKTEIYAASLSDAERRLVFSDEGPNFEITPVDGEQAMVFARDKAYARGLEREWRTGPSPGIFSKPPGIYELSLNGSNRWRKIVELGAEDSPGRLFATAAGSKLAYLTGEYGKETVSIFELPAGTLLHTWNARKWSHIHCPEVNFGRAGWLPDEKALYITLQSADVEDDSPGSACNQTYFATEDGEDLGKAPVESDLVQAGGRPSESIGYYFLARSNDGYDLFAKYGVPRGAKTQSAPKGPVVMAISPNLKPREQAQLRTQPFANQFWVSPSGRYVAFLEGRLTESYQSEMHAWVKDIKTGKEFDVVGVPPLKYGSPEPWVTLSVLGVADGE